MFIDCVWPSNGLPISLSCNACFLLVLSQQPPGSGWPLLVGAYQVVLQLLDLAITACGNDGLHVWCDGHTAAGRKACRYSGHRSGAQPMCRRCCSAGPLHELPEALGC